MNFRNLRIFFRKSLSQKIFTDESYHCRKFWTPTTKILIINFIIRQKISFKLLSSIMRIPLIVMIIFALMLMSGNYAKELADNELGIPGVGRMVIETIIRECPAGACSDDDVQKMAAWVDDTPEFLDSDLPPCTRG